MEFNNDQFNEIVLKCQHSPVGKHLPKALYIHASALGDLDPQLQAYERQARQIGSLPEEATLVKFNTEKPSISYLFYPDFDGDPHPALQGSYAVNLQTEESQYRDYRTSANPPILHRKETFVTPDYPRYAEFARLTHEEEALGLLENSRFIGTRQPWLQRLRHHGVEIRGHRLRKLDSKATSVFQPRIERHKAAMVRKQLSRPVRAALEAELFAPGTTFFDCGCGYGSDVKLLARKGYASAGWDPYYCPDRPCKPADVVNLGYVINVIEDPAERREALLKAWGLAQKVLIVAAQVLISDRASGQIAYGDGIITRRNTFQKYYEQEELKIYIDQVLEVNSVPVGLGIYFAFRDEAQAEIFRASRFRSRATTPRVRAKVRNFEDYEQMLAPLMGFVTERGRLPAKGELLQEEEILAEFGNFRRAFKTILQATNEEEWDAIAEQRRQDLKVYLALSHFGKRLRASELSRQAKEDFKALFGSYKKACLLADMMLFSVGDLDNIADLCCLSPVGKLFESSFRVHISTLERLDPLLRLYEGCASRTIGRLESVTAIAFHLKAPKISYLSYPDFDSDPHPALHARMQIDLRDLDVRYWECDRDNPPILHEKDALVAPDYPHYEKFAKLTRQERDRGLFDNPKAIRQRQGWLQCLEDNCLKLVNHRLYWRKDADPYKLKALRAATATRQRQRKAAEKRLAEN